MCRLNSNVLWLVEAREPLLRDRLKDHVMDSVYYYLRYNVVRRKYNPYRLMVDSGAYTAARKGVLLDVDRVVDVQESLKADIAVPLDYPFMPGMDFNEMTRRVELTIRNTLLWGEIISPLIKITPIVHAVGAKGLREVIRKISNANRLSGVLGMGTVVLSPMQSEASLKGFLGDRQPRLELINSIVEFSRMAREHDFKVHVSGLGSSPLMIYLAVYLGVDSTDTSGYRRRAAYGKILLPGFGERYVGDGRAKFGAVKLGRSELELLKNCDCPVCRMDPSMLFKDWRARAIHNEYVLKRTWKNALELANRDITEYERFLNKIFLNSTLRYLWKYAKMIRRYRKVVGYES